MEPLLQGPKRSPQFQYSTILCPIVRLFGSHYPSICCKSTGLSVKEFILQQKYKVGSCSTGQPQVHFRSSAVSVNVRVRSCASSSFDYNVLAIFLVWQVSTLVCNLSGLLCGIFFYNFKDQFYTSRLYSNILKYC